MNQIFAGTYPLRNVLWNAENSLVRDLMLVILGVMIIGLSAQCVIPFKPVPLTFQSATVVLIGMIYGCRLGSLTILAYLFSGLLGLPVFAELSSGVGIFFGPTAGYLIGFLPAAFLGGLLVQRGWGRSIFSAYLAASLSTIIIFLFGVLVLSFFIGFKEAILLGVAPFLISEPVKLLLVASITPKFWKRA